jgi:outer membrane receptor protein involved in Fe transport
MKLFICAFLQLLLFHTVCAQNSVKGKIADNRTGELLIGATVKAGNQNTLAGLDGSFTIRNVVEGKQRFVFSFIGYQTIDTVILVTPKTFLNIKLKDASSTLGMVTVVGHADRESDSYAKRAERESLNVINVISAKAIQLSPDITVANVLQRVSGVSLERSSSGDGRYAIIRGMDKRYNYTLVNGVKIPSPDNKNRYVPLDIFPADLVERIEVSKTLTANMEADAIGGVVNLVMKNAPDRLYIQGGVSAGYNQTLLDRPYQQFSVDAVNKKSPYQQFGSAYSAKPTDFTRENLKYQPKSLTFNKYGVPQTIGVPSTFANFSIGNRFFNKKLGAMLGTSYSNDFRGNSSIFNPTDGEYFDGGTFNLKNNNNRSYSTQLTRTGINAKFDYNINTKNSLKFYSLYAILDEAQTRLTVDTVLLNPRTTAGTGAINYFGRSRYQRQNIYNGTLQGDHSLITDELKLNWSAVYSIAKSNVPDQAEYEYDGGFYPEPGRPDASPSLRPNVLQNYNRTWIRNTDTDLAGYLNLILDKKFKSIPYTFSVGGLYRAKNRDNYFDTYLLKPLPASGGGQQEWSGIDNFNWEVFNPSGSASNGNNYNMTENIAAAYAMLKFNLSKLETTFGVRGENTAQDFVRNVPVTSAAKTASISYLDILPSVALKYLLNPKTNIRLSYFSSISRPGYYELVPTPPTYGDDFTTSGNANLKHTKAENLDFRFEYFPKNNEQILIGAFYKKIKDPIEYGFVFTGSQSSVLYQPNNYGEATNFGFEFVYEKYIKQFGIRANYTYTNSAITTAKKKTDKVNGTSETTFPNEKRSLQGQSKNIANVALLYKNLNIGLDFQVTWQFTGNRIVLVSPYYGFDYHQRYLHLFDFSVEKKIGKRLSVFTKVKNLLNTPYEVYINQTPLNTLQVPQQFLANGKTLVQKDVFGQTYQLGLHYKIK